MDGDRTAQAEHLVQGGSADERIEAVTGLPLAEILAIRARLATPQQTRRDDRVCGPAWWRRRPSS